MEQMRLCIYFIKPPEIDRWVPGDRFVRPFIRRLLRGKPTVGGVERVFINLCKGLEKINVPYVINLPFNKLAPKDVVIALGVGKFCLAGYNQKNKVIAGIGMMTHPTDWLNFTTEFPVVAYLQHCEWVRDVFVPYFGKICDIWPVGIETDKWKPSSNRKNTDVLIYNKILWNHGHYYQELRNPVIEFLEENSISYTEVVYGNYKPEQYKKALSSTQAMIFLSAHESQGIACQEALAMNIPVFAWDQGKCLDPNRFRWGQPEIPATSVPYFDERCGMRFKDSSEFRIKFPLFWNSVVTNQYRPREYVLENLSLEKSAQRMIEIVHSYAKEF